MTLKWYKQKDNNNIYKTWQEVQYCWLASIILKSIIVSMWLGKRQLYASKHAKLLCLSSTSSRSCDSFRRWRLFLVDELDAGTHKHFCRQINSPEDLGTTAPSPCENSFSETSARNRPVHSQHVNTDTSPVCDHFQWLFYSWLSLKRTLFTVYTTFFHSPAPLTSSISFKISDARIMEFTIHLM